MIRRDLLGHRELGPVQAMFGWLLHCATVAVVRKSRRILRSVYTVLSMSFFAVVGVALVVAALLAAAGVYALVQAVRELLGYSSWYDGES